MQIRFIFLLFLLCLPATGLLAQSQTEVPAPSIEDENLQAIRLDELARLLQKKIEQRASLEKSLAGNTEEIPAEIQTTLNNLNRDIGNLSATFEMIALSNTDTTLLDGTRCSTDRLAPGFTGYPEPVDRITEIDNQTTAPSGRSSRYGVPQ